MRICIVGSGRMAGSHSRSLSSIPDVRLHTVVDPDMEYTEAFRRQYGYEKALPSLSEALAAGGFDAVVVCTPNPLHAPQSAAALRAKVVDAPKNLPAMATDPTSSRPASAPAQ